MQESLKEFGITESAYIESLEKEISKLKKLNSLWEDRYNNMVILKDSYKLGVAVNLK
jgi:hypothetical protein